MFRALNLLKQRVGSLLAYALQLEQIFFFQVIDIGKRVDQRPPRRSLCNRPIIRLLNRLLSRMLRDGMAKQLRNHHLAQTLDIHHAPRSEVPQLFFESSWAACINATPIYLSLFAHKLGLATWTICRKRNRTARNARSLLLNHASDLGNYVAPALHLDDVADPHPKPLDLIRVVQRRPC